MDIFAFYWEEENLANLAEMHLFDHEILLCKCNFKILTSQCNAICVLKAVKLAINYLKHGGNLMLNFKNTSDILLSGLKYPNPELLENHLNFFDRESCVKLLLDIFYEIRMYLLSDYSSNIFYSQEYIKIAMKYCHKAEKNKILNFWKIFLDVKENSDLEKMLYDIAKQHSKTRRMVLSTRGIATLNFDEASIFRCIEALRNELDEFRCNEKDKLSINRLLDLSLVGLLQNTAPPPYDHSRFGQQALELQYLPPPYENLRFRQQALEEVRDTMDRRHFQFLVQE